MIAAAVISGFIYPIVAHWVWGGGWLPQLGVRALGALSIAAFTAVYGLILFFVLKKVKMLRVLRDAELFGIDIALHKTYAYPKEMADQQFGRYEPTTFPEA